VRLRHFLPLVVLMVVPVFLAKASTAAPPAMFKFQLCVQNGTSPTCGTGANSVFDGNTASAPVTVTLSNDRSSTTFIQSANVNLPAQLNLVAGSGSPSANVSTSGQQLRIRGIKIQPGKTFVATFRINTACGGQFAWPAGEAWSGDNQTGTVFSQSGVSTGVSTTLNTGCYLGFVDQPTDTAIGQTIGSQGASAGGPVTVGLFDSTGQRMSSCPVGFTSSCNAIVGRTPTDGTFGNDPDSLTQPLTGTPLVASFSNLKIGITTQSEQFRLTATGDGSFAPIVNSASFLVADGVQTVPCNGGKCTLNQKKLDASRVVSFADVNGPSGFTFMTLSPYTLDFDPKGCVGRPDFGFSGFAESDGRAPGSAMTVRYYVDQNTLKANYGTNTGQQFIPICAGGRPVDPTTHQPIDCTELDSIGGFSHGWVALVLNAKGGFAGKIHNAYCEADGYYWGILSSYQDKIDGKTNPVVTNWGGQNIDGNNYRFFDMTIPGNWDWRSGP
jgi:hypothetical protein